MSIQDVKRKFIHTNRPSEPLQKFQNVRIILLDTIWELLLNAQLKSSDSKGNQALNSLTQCKDFLDDCLKSLHDSDYDLSNTYRTLISSTAFSKFDITILDKYITSLEDAMRDYVEDQGVFRDKQHKDAAKKALHVMLVENIGIIQLAIQMLEFITEKDKSSLLKLSGSVVSNTLKIHQDVKIPKKNIPVSETNEMKERTSDLITPKYQRNKRIKGSGTSWSNSNSTNCCRLSGGKSLVKSKSKESVYSKFYLRAFQKFRKKSCMKMPAEESDSSSVFLRGIKKFRIEVNKHLDKFRRTREKSKILEDIVSSRASFGVSRFPTDSMREAAMYIIDTFLSLKSNSRSSAKCDRYLTGLKNMDIGLDDIWLELCEMHHQMLFDSTDSTTEDLKETLAHFYITKMQILLQKNMGNMGKPQFVAARERRHSRRPTLGMTSSLVKLLKTQNLSENRVIEMHKQFYTIQLDKLRESRKTFNVRRLYYLIMQRMVPEIQSDYELFKQYETDPEHYDVLMMMINRDSQRENLLQIFQANFEEIKLLMDRERRRQKMTPITELHKKRQDSSDTRSTATLKDTRIVLDDDFFELERGKWAKFFDEQEKSNLEHNLASKRRQKQKYLDDQKVIERKQKILQERRKTEAMKCIVSLYEAPRLTHRMRQAMEQIAEEKSLDLSSQTHRKKVVKKEETLEVKRYTLADALLESQSWMSCCSKCRRLQNETSCKSALDRFHRIHEQILDTSTYC